MTHRDPPPDDPLRSYKEWREDDPAWQIHILGLRVTTLTKEKEDLENDLEVERGERRKLEERVAKMEKSFQRGAGAMIMLPIIGTVVGFVFAYGKIIFGGAK